MSTKKKVSTGNPQKTGKKVYLVRKVQPSLPHGASSSFSGPNLILDFLGADISPDRKEVFSSLVLNKKIAIDIKKRMDAYLEYLSDYEDDEDDEDFESQSTDD